MQPAVCNKSLKWLNGLYWCKGHSTLPNIKPFITPRLFINLKYAGPYALWRHQSTKWSSCWITGNAIQFFSLQLERLFLVLHYPLAYRVTRWPEVQEESSCSRFPIHVSTRERQMQMWSLQNSFHHTHVRELQYAGCTCVLKMRAWVSKIQLYCYREK